MLNFYGQEEKGEEEKIAEFPDENADEDEKE